MRRLNSLISDCSLQSHRPLPTASMGAARDPRATVLKPPPAVRRHRGFTLIELSVSIAIVGLLIALLLPAAQAVRESARKQGCRNNLRQIGIATHNYESRHGVLPLAHGGDLAGIQVKLLADLEQSAMAADFSVGWEHGTLLHQRTRITVYICPSQPGDFVGTNYGLNSGRRFDGRDRGGFRSELPSLRIRDVTDGVSNTCFIAEFRASKEFDERSLVYSTTYDYADEIAFAAACENVVGVGRFSRGSPWPSFDDNTYDHLLPPNRHNCWNGPDAPFRKTDNCGSHHVGGANVLVLDGSVRFVSDGVDRPVWWAIGTRDGGEPLSFP